MKRKSIVAAIGSVALMATPALSQAPEDLDDGIPWAAALVGAGVLAGWILLILDDDDDDQDAPASP